MYVIICFMVTKMQRIIVSDIYHTNHHTNTSTNLLSIANARANYLFQIKIFSSNVSKHLSPGKTVIEYLIKTRLHQLNSLLMTFLPF